MSAPIVLFVYNRLEHTKQTIAALQKNEGASDSDLIIFSDGPKGDKDFQQVSDLREYLGTINGFNSISITHRPQNIGLAKSIIDGVTQVVNEYGEVIVMEDDLVTSPYFLRFMNEGLMKYRSAEKVISIHGYVLPVNETLPQTFFLRGADCWGWATWQRGWDLFNPDGVELMRQLRRQKLTYTFDFDGGVPFTAMLQQQIEGHINSWAIRWHAAAFLQNKLTLYPGKSLVKNIGTDGSGTHKEKNPAAHEPYAQHIPLVNMRVEESSEARAAIFRYIYGQKSLLGKLKKVLKGIFK